MFDRTFESSGGLGIECIDIPENDSARPLRRQWQLAILAQVLVVITP